MARCSCKVWKAVRTNDHIGQGKACMLTDGSSCALRNDSGACIAVCADDRKASGAFRCFVIKWRVNSDHSSYELFCNVTVLRRLLIASSVILVHAEAVQK